jgi:hypothetical protein
MFKYLLYIGVGYLVFKVAKNGFKLLLSNYQQTKELNEPSELVKCSECDSYVSKGIAITNGKQDFCSEDCFEKYQNRDSTP